MELGEEEGGRDKIMDRGGIGQLRDRHPQLSGWDVTWALEQLLKD